MIVKEVQEFIQDCKNPLHRTEIICEGLGMLILCAIVGTCLFLGMTM